jgi:hypothetical protein
VTLRLKLKGVVEGVRVKGTSKLRGEIDWSTGLFEFEISVAVCSKGLGCERVTLVDEVALNPDEGLWRLDLDLVEIDGENLGGSAVATLGDGRVLHYDVKARYSSKTDRWSLVLKGAGRDAGSRIKLKDVQMSEVEIQGAAIRYKVLGSRGASGVIP